MRRRPYSVLLFDEIEKAHPDVLNILLQILDEGKLTDAQGRTVNFENTVIIMTTNAGSERRENALGFGKTEEDASRERTMKSLGEFLRPEFIARVDEVLVFHRLTLETLTEVAKLMLGEYVDTLKEKGIRFTFDDAVCSYFAKKAEKGKCGARDLRSMIRREAEDKITQEIISRGSDDISGINLVLDDGKIALQVV